MAQRRHASPTARRLAKRYGIMGAASTAAALALVCALAAAAGSAMQLGQTGFSVIARDETPRQGSSDATDAAPPASQDSAADGAQTSGAGGEESPSSEGERRLVVHVDGAVAQPGIVEVRGSDVRVFDAVEASGGLLDDADTSAVNLAETLVDGAKIHIPRQGEEDPALPASAAGQHMTSEAVGTGSAKALVNLNTATAEELQALPGVGEATARAILEDREANGPYLTPEDLMRVSGIGEKKFAKMSGSVCV